MFLVAINFYQLSDIIVENTKGFEQIYNQA